MGLFSEVNNDPLFGVTELTNWVDKRKYVPRFLSQLIPFEEKGIMTSDLLIEERQQTLNLLPFVARGGNPTRRDRDARTMRKLTIPAHKAERLVLADELLSVRAPGELRKWGYREIINDYLATMLDEMQATKEVHIANLLQGLVKDPVSGATYINYFTEYGVSQEAEIDFDLDNATPAQGALTLKINTMRRTMRDNAEDLDTSGVIGLCSAGFWDLLVVHKEVTESYKFDAQSDFLRQQISEGSFKWRGVTWIEYSRSAAGTALVPADKVLLFPISSATELYKRRFAPPDFFSEDLSNEVVGRELYVPPLTVDPMHPNAPEWVKVELRSFPLNYIVRPKVLMIGRKT
jgi:hypothetical protein